MYAKEVLWWMILCETGEDALFMIINGRANSIANSENRQRSASFLKQRRDRNARYLFRMLPGTFSGRVILRGEGRILLLLPITGTNRSKKCLFKIRLSMLPGILVNFVVDSRNLLTPAPPFPVFHIHHRFVRPVEVVRNKGYLLINLLEWVTS
jgi:hypothetical protein